MSILIVIGILAYCIGGIASLTVVMSVDRTVDRKFALWFSLLWPVGWLSIMVVTLQEKHAGKQRERINEHLNRPQTLHLR